MKIQRNCLVFFLIIICIPWHYVHAMAPRTLIRPSAKNTLQRTICTRISPLNKRISTSPFGNVNPSKIAVTKDTIKDITYQTLSQPAPAKKSPFITSQQSYIPSFGIATQYQGPTTDIDFFNEEPITLSDEAAHEIQEMCELAPAQEQTIDTALDLQSDATESPSSSVSENIAPQIAEIKLDTTEEHNPGEETLVTQEAAEKAAKIATELEELAKKIDAHQAKITQQEEAQEKAIEAENEAIKKFSDAENNIHTLEKQEVHEADKQTALEQEFAQKEKRVQEAELRLQEAEIAEERAKEHARELAIQEARARAAQEASEKRLQEIKEKIAAQEAKLQEQQIRAKQARAEEKKQLAQEIDKQERKLQVMQKELVTAQQGQLTGQQTATEIAIELQKIAEQKELIQDEQIKISQELEQITQQQEQITLELERAEKERVRQEIIGPKIGVKSPQSPDTTVSEGTKKIAESSSKPLNSAAEGELAPEPITIDKVGIQPAELSQLIIPAQTVPAESLLTHSVPKISGGQQPISYQEVGAIGGALEIAPKEISQPQELSFNNPAIPLEIMHEEIPEQTSTALLKNDKPTQFHPQQHSIFEKAGTPPDKEQSLATEQITNTLIHTTKKAPANKPTPTIKELTPAREEQPKKVTPKPTVPRTITIVETEPRKTSIQKSFTREQSPSTPYIFESPYTWSRPNRTTTLPTTEPSSQPNVPVIEIGSSSEPEPTPESDDAGSHNTSQTVAPEDGISRDSGSLDTSTTDGFDELYPIFEEEYDHFIEPAEVTKFSPHTATHNPSVATPIPDKKLTSEKNRTTMQAQPQKNLKKDSQSPNSQKPTKKNTSLPIGAYVVTALLFASIITPVAIVASKKIAARWAQKK